MKEEAKDRLVTHLILPKSSAAQADGRARARAHAAAAPAAFAFSADVVRDSRKARQ